MGHSDQSFPSNFFSSFRNFAGSYHFFNVDSILGRAALVSSASAHVKPIPYTSSSTLVLLHVFHSSV